MNHKLDFYPNLEKLHAFYINRKMVIPYYIFIFKRMYFIYICLSMNRENEKG